jgi:hypothetical protein
MTTINKDHHRLGRRQKPLPSTMTAIAAVNNQQQPLASVWQQRWRLSTVVIAVVVNSGNGGVLSSFSKLGQMDK